MELLFSPEERDLSIFQGFRGRPAIGTTIFSKAVNFNTGAWRTFRDEVRKAAASNETVPVVLAGSVFGGSGAAGVPTICRLLGSEFRRQTKNVRLGLILFLPYFQFREVEDEAMQADSASFSIATSESLKYYDEGKFLDADCHSIYAMGEEIMAEMRVSAVGAEEQRNDPHFLELVAALAATGFMTGKPESDDHTLSLAVRKDASTVRWADLPTAKGKHDAQILRLQHMTLFAVAFRYIFYPNIVDDLTTGRNRHHFVRKHLVRAGVSSETALHELAAVSEYVNYF